MVHLPAMWPRVFKGVLAPPEASLGAWCNVSDAKIETSGDVLLDMYESVAVCERSRVPALWEIL